MRRCAHRLRPSCMTLFFCVLDGAGNPLLVTDRPRGRLMDGFPAEDLLAAVKSFDASDPKCQSCSVYTSVAYFREWMVRTIKGRSEPSRCSLSPKYEPQERIPAGWRQTRPLCKSEVNRRRSDRSLAPSLRTICAKASVYILPLIHTMLRRRVKTDPLSK